ncbi:unnamed protein product [Thlaspi arvense]|uniref:Small auxin up regulated protein n=1 Tax=Thlaspi arvense TaxID=13288 RepID=A0AAU9RGX1_THLAR|nr:unnamed protein product [Thlaspi arvense]
MGLRVKNAAKQLQRCFHHLKRMKKIADESNPTRGYFPVVTMGNAEAKRFLVDLSYLAYPPFLKLLEEAEHEFGFDQPRVLTVPCDANELHTILLRKRVMSDMTSSIQSS